MSIFTKGTVQAKSTETTEKQKAQLYINLGFPVTVGDKEVFIELPLSLTADNLDKAIQTVKNNIKPTSPESIVEILQGKIAIAEAVQAVFKAIPEGEEIIQDHIDPDNEQFGFLSGLKVRFYRAHSEEKVDTSTKKVSMIDKFKAVK